MFRVIRLAAIAVLLSLVPALSQAEGQHGGNFTFHDDAERDGGWSGPDCGNPKVMARVQKRFAQTERAYWNTGVRIDTLYDPREIAYRDWTPLITAIRSCRAQADLSDGRRVSVVYWVRSEQGFAGHGYGVDYCIYGRDWPYAYAPGCREILPR
ncbi:hypothetical protein ACKTEK_11180 [Tepidamorphus sp. 3E244]|uniref:hypothetical protein n=1 Tax=Tepidamorphus sp. 3E244 TaxID=3385498 RepID=UPI0038FC8682